jgi:hypothetical protein
MSKETKFAQFIQAFESFSAQKPEEFLTGAVAYTDFDGPDVAESRANLQFILQTVADTKNLDVRKLVPWNAFNSLVGVAQQVANTYSQYRVTRDQGSYQQFAMSLDTMAFHLRMYGVAALANGDAQRESKLSELTSELDRLSAASREVVALRDQVRELITPAVAGSLSKAFTDRKSALFIGRLFWLVVTIVAAVGGIYATSLIGAEIATAIANSKDQQGVFPWTATLVRSLYILPVYAAFGFAYAQYRKERDFEEQYAHKAALAISLPNYGDLARDNAVKDQIVTGATTVVFAPPVSQKGFDLSARQTLGSVKEILDSLAGLIARRK